MSRSEAIKKNIQTNLIFFFINIGLNFVSKTIFIYIFGQEILGLDTVLISFLGFLNLADLGISSAISYKLYKPLVDGNYERVRDTVDLLGIYYKFIGCSIIIIGIILSLFLKKFIKSDMSNILIYGAYSIFVIKNATMYFLGHRQILLNADEKQHIVVSNTGIISIARLAFQIIFAIATKSYIIWLFIELVCSILINIRINRKYKQIYSKLLITPKKKYKDLKLLHSEIFSYVKPMFFHKITSFIVYQTDTLLISYFTTLALAGTYSNYMFIINLLITLINTFTSALTASIGKIIAEQDKHKTKMFYSNLSILSYFIATVIVFCFVYLANDFVNIWIGSEYLFSDAVVLVLGINMFIQISRQPIVSFKLGYGLVSDVFAPVIEGLINLGFSWFLVQHVGIIGIFLGTFISNMVIVVIWQPYYIATRGFKMTVRDMFIELSKLMALSILSVLIGYQVCEYILGNYIVENFIDFFLKSGSTFAIIFVVSLGLFGTVSFKNIQGIMFRKKDEKRNER